jgi:hypothetical protein
MKRIIRLTESDLTRIVKRVLEEQPTIPTGLTHKLVSVTRKGTNVIGITEPTVRGGAEAPTRWDGCKKEGNSNCIEYPALLADGRHSATEGTCSNCDFFIKYMGSKYLCRFGDKPCKKI